MMNKEHTLLCILGKSGVGKDSLADELCKRLGFEKLISYTTRPRRENEGETHRFVTEETYEEMSANGQVSAYTEINGYKYWSTIDQLMNSNIYIIDPAGVKTLKDLKIPGLNIIVVYIHVPDEVREERAILKRGDNKTVFRSRSLSERQQFRDLEREVDYDYSIKNLDFAKSFCILKRIATIEGITPTIQNSYEEAVE